MKRSTWITVGLFAVLLAVWAAKTLRPAPQGPPALTVDGYLGNITEEDARAADKDGSKVAQVKQLVVKTSEATWTLQQLPADVPKDSTPVAGKPADNTAEPRWKVQRSAGGKSTEAKAQPYRAKAMAEVFARSLRSSFAKEVADNELAEYGLDAAHAIDVTADIAGKQVRLRIGQSDKPRDSGDTTTWVQDPSRPKVVYQIAGRDLRAPFAIAWADLRDRALLTLNTAAVERLEVDNPADRRATHFVLQRPPLGTAKERDGNAGWQLVAPTGFEVGEVDGWLKSIERLSATDFVDAAQLASTKEDPGFDDAKTAARLRIVAGGETTTIVVGRASTQPTSKDVWMRIEGRDELYKIAPFMRDQVLQQFDQVRNRKLLGTLKVEAATAITVRHAGSTWSATQAGGTWSIAQPAMQGDTTKLQAYLADLASTSVDFADDVSAAAAGLDAPDTLITLDFGTAQRVIALGKEKDGAIWGQAGPAAGAGDKFTLTGFAASKVRKKAEEFEDKRLLLLAPEAITRIAMTSADGKGFTVEKQSDAWKLNVSGALQTIKPEVMATWITALVTAERDGARLDRNGAPSGTEPATTIEVTGSKGDTWTLRLVTGPDGAAKATTGKVEVLASGRARGYFGVSAATLASLQRTAADLSGDGKPQ